MFGSSALMEIGEPIQVLCEFMKDLSTIKVNKDSNKSDRGRSPYEEGILHII